MSFTDEPLDPERPWIDDPRDTPAGMKWLPTLFNPFGTTSRLHFTRAWTALFFGRVLVFLIPAIVVAVLSGAGANNPQGAALPPWGFPLVLLITAVMSYVLHLRRFADARRSPLWALVVFVPVTIGLVGFMLGIVQGEQQYQKAVEERAQQNAPAIERVEEEETATDTDPGSEEDGENGADNQGRQGREEAPLDVTAISVREHAFNTALDTAVAFWALPSFLAMLWTLLWVGRLPNGGGTIRERLRQMEQRAASAEF